MRPPDRRGLRALVGWVVALGAVAALAVVVPGTSSAFTASVTNSANTAAAKARFLCADTFAGDSRRRSAFFEYTFREDAGATVAVDSGASGNSGAYDGTKADDRASPRPCPADRGAPYLLDGTTSRVTTSSLLPVIRTDFSIEVWFKTTSTAMKIMGFERNQRQNSDNYDKQLYVDYDGHLRYGIYDGSTRTITTPDAVNDGSWHQAVASTSSSEGSVLYLDGIRVASDPNGTVAESFAGYWRIGEGHTELWPSAPAYSHFAGALSFAAAYGTVLTAGEVRSDYDIGLPGAVGAVLASGASPEASPTASASPATEKTATPSASAAPSASSEPASATTPPSAAPVSSGSHPQETAILVTPSEDINASQ